MGETDAVLMIASLICILLLNTFIFLYNQAPITPLHSFNGSGSEIGTLDTDLNETISDTSTGLSNTFGVIGFFINIVKLFLGWYFDFPVIVNLIIKFATYVLGITFWVTLLRFIRGN